MTLAMPRTDTAADGESAGLPLEASQPTLAAEPALEMAAH